MVKKRFHERLDPDTTYCVCFFLDAVLDLQIDAVSDSNGINIERNNFISCLIPGPWSFIGPRNQEMNQLIIVFIEENNSCLKQQSTVGFVSVSSGNRSIIKDRNETKIRNI